MEEIRQEFETFLKELVATYPKAANTVLSDPSSLRDVGSKSRDYFAKADAKIREIADKHPSIPIQNIKPGLSDLIVRYHSELMRGHL